LARNTIRARAFAALSIWAIQTIHANLLSGVENTPVGMLTYHLSASVCDLLVILFSRSFLSSRLLLEVQTVNLASIVANGAGWLLYMSYHPPAMYNLMIAALGFLQWAILLFRGRYDDMDMGGTVLCAGPRNCGK
jgi:hypothetical protein